MNVDPTYEPSHNSAQQLLKDLSFCVFDLETTGSNTKQDKIIEIGIVRIENLQIVQELNYLINPQMPIPNFVQKLTSLTPEKLKDKPILEDVIDEIVDFMKDSILVAHNSSFDVPFLNAILKLMNKKPLKNKVLCTNLMTKYLLPEIMNSNLPYMSDLFKIPHKAHRALEDAKATAKLLLKYLEIFIEKDIRKINQLYYPRNKFELDRIHIKEKEKLHSLVNKIKQFKTPIIITLKGEKGVILTQIPILNPKDEWQELQNIAESFNWETMTIKMIGSLLEGLYIFNENFYRIPQNESQRIVENLTEKYLKDVELDSDEENHKKAFLNKYMNYFLFIPHLIPGQLILFFLPGINKRQNLIFRYPAQKNKLIQFIQKNVQKNRHKKYSLTGRHTIVKPLFALFEGLLSHFEKNGEKYLLLKFSDFEKNDRAFFQKLDEFTNEQMTTANFPEQHL